MHRIAGDMVGQNRDLQPAGRLAQASPVTVPVFGKAEEELTVMSAVGQMADVSQ
jgi:hypothetical protein